MAISISICVAVLVCLAIFPDARRNLTPVTFLLGGVLLCELYFAMGMGPFIDSSGYGMVPMIGAAMVFMMAAGMKGKTFTILQRIPASAYRAVAPAVISVLVLMLIVFALLM